MAIIIPPFDIARVAVIQVDELIKQNIRALLLGVVNDPAVAALTPSWWPTDVNVVARWLLNMEAKDWPTALRGLASGDEGEDINGFLITRRRRRPTVQRGANYAQGQMSGEKLLEFDYAINYFKSFETGNIAVNTEDSMGAMLEAIDEGFDANPTLGFDQAIQVDGNDVLEVKGIGPGWTVDNIDIIGGRYHFVQSHLTAYIAKLIRQL